MQEASSEQSSKAIFKEQSLLQDFFAAQKVAIFYNFFSTQWQLHPELISVYFLTLNLKCFNNNLFMAGIKCFVGL